MVPARRVVRSRRCPDSCGGGRSSPAARSGCTQRSHHDCTYRAYTATLLGDYLDIKVRQTTRADAYASDRYDASQKLGEEVRVSGGAGLLYDSLRRRTGANVIAHRPRNITDIVQTDHFEITVLATSRTIDVRKLSL